MNRYDLAECIGATLTITLNVHRTDHGLDDHETWANQSTGITLAINPQSGGTRIRLNGKPILDIWSTDGSPIRLYSTPIPAFVMTALARADAAHSGRLAAAAAEQLGNDITNADLARFASDLADADDSPKGSAFAAMFATWRATVEELTALRQQVSTQVEAALAHLDDVKRFGWTDRMQDAEEAIAQLI